MEKYYLDTCIWLNLFKKEENGNKKYWEITKKFIKESQIRGDTLITTGFIQKEISFKLEKNSLKEAFKFMGKTKNVMRISAKNEDYILARNLEKNWNYKISFFDCIHTAITKRINAILVTRDKLLIKKAKQIIKVILPEEFFSESVNFS